MTPQEILDQDFGTIPNLIRLHAKLQPELTALALHQHRMSYRELDRLMDRIAVALQRDGVRPRDAVAICALSSPEYAAVFFRGLARGRRVGAAVAVGDGGKPARGADRFRREAFFPRRGGG